MSVSQRWPRSAIVLPRGAVDGPRVPGLWDAAVDASSALEPPVRPWAR
jgi:hypothetical protein